MKKNINKTIFYALAIILSSAFFLPQNAYAQERFVVKPSTVKIIKTKPDGSTTTYEHPYTLGATYTHLATQEDDIEIYYQQGGLVSTYAAYEWNYKLNESGPLTPLTGETKTSLSRRSVGVANGSRIYYILRDVSNPPIVIGGKPQEAKTLFTIVFRVYADYAIDAVSGNKSSALSVYPNPVSETLFINAPVSNEDGANANTLVLSSESGKMVKTLQLNESKTEINVSGLDNGRYILRMEDNAGKLIDYKHITVKH